MSDENVEIVFTGSEGVIFPSIQTIDACGHDIHSFEDVIIERGARKVVSTGLYLKKIPSNICSQISPRSGLSSKGIDVCIGIVDPGYEGEWKVTVVNNSNENFEVKKGMRIAQVVFFPFIRPKIISPNGIKKITKERGDGGFGSTGLF